MSQNYNIISKWISYFFAIALIFGCVNVGAADDISCPVQPNAISESDKKTVDAAVGKIKGLGLAELRMNLEKQRTDTFSKMPSGDDVYKEQMFFSTFCSVIKNDKNLTNGERRKLINEYLSVARRHRVDVDFKNEYKNREKNLKSNLKIRINIDHEAPVAFEKSNSGQKVFIKFNALLSNLGNSPFSIISWRAWEQIPTDLHPDSGRMFEPKLVISNSPEHNYEFPIDLPAGSTKKLSILAPYDIPDSIWGDMVYNFQSGKIYRFLDLDSLLPGDYPYKAFGQYRQASVQVSSSPVPATNIIRYVPSEYYQCFAIEFTLADGKRVGAQFSLFTIDAPQALIKYSPPPDCKNSERSSVLRQ